MLQYDKYVSPMGTLWLTGQDGMLTGLSFDRNFSEDAQRESFELAKRWLENYFRGQPRKIDFPMNPQGTAFQKLVWNLLLEIPYRQTRTYGQLAKQAAALLNKEKMSPQAVGQVVGRNPIAVIVPCHRCVGSDGTLTGYAYGLERKAWLLKHEQREWEEKKCGMQISEESKQSG